MMETEKISIKYDLNKTYEQNLILNDIDPVEVLMFNISGIEYLKDNQKGGKPFTVRAILMAIAIGALGISIHAGILGITYIMSSPILCGESTRFFGEVMANIPLLQFDAERIRCNSNDATFRDLMSLARSIGGYISGGALVVAGQIILSPEQTQQAQRILENMQAVANAHPGAFARYHQRGGKYRSKTSVRKNKKLISNNKKN